MTEVRALEFRDQHQQPGGPRTLTDLYSPALQGAWVVTMDYHLADGVYVGTTTVKKATEYVEGDPENMVSLYTQKAIHDGSAAFPKYYTEVVNYRGPDILGSYLVAVDTPSGPYVGSLLEKGMYAYAQPGNFPLPGEVSIRLGSYDAKAITTMDDLLALRPRDPGASGSSDALPSSWRLGTLWSGSRIMDQPPQQCIPEDGTLDHGDAPGVVVFWLVKYFGVTGWISMDDGVSLGRSAGPQILRAEYGGAPNGAPLQMVSGGITTSEVTHPPSPYQQWWASRSGACGYYGIGAAPYHHFAMVANFQGYGRLLII